MFRYLPTLALLLIPTLASAAPTWFDQGQSAPSFVAGAELPGAVAHGLSKTVPLGVCSTTFQKARHVGTLIHGKCRIVVRGKVFTQKTYRFLKATRDLYWAPTLTERAIIGGELDKMPTYICQGMSNNQPHPGHLYKGLCYMSDQQKMVKTKTYRVLSSGLPSIKWVKSKKAIPTYAISLGFNSKSIAKDKSIYLCRTLLGRTWQMGTVVSNGCLYNAGKAMVSSPSFEYAMAPKGFKWKRGKSPGYEIPFDDAATKALTLCRSFQRGSFYPGLVRGDKCAGYVGVQSFFASDFERLITQQTTPAHKWVPNTNSYNASQVFVNTPTGKVYFCRTYNNYAWQIGVMVKSLCRVTNGNTTRTSKSFELLLAKKALKWGYRITTSTVAGGLVNGEVRYVCIGWKDKAWHPGQLTGNVCQTKNARLKTYKVLSGH